MLQAMKSLCHLLNVVKICLFRLMLLIYNSDLFPVNHF